MVRFYRVALLVAVGLVCLVVVAAANQTATVQTAHSDSYGQYLTDAQGNSLYLYTKDSKNTSTCTGQCTKNWPPLTTEGQPTAGQGVDASLLGTIQRSDGSTQVTYNGWPLYRYVRDAKPGDINGQKLGGVFFLVSPKGDSLIKEITQQAPQASQEELATLMQEGKKTFTAICSTCHGDEGQGLVGPAFDGNKDLADSGFVIDTILGGIPTHGMPAFGDQFSDEQVAAIATFIRNSWSNNYGAVTKEEVAKMR